jgi:hypothetical protein
MGAAEQPSVALWEPSKNQRVTKSPALQSAGAALSVNLLEIKERQKIAAAEENNPRFVLRAIPLLILYFFSGSPTQTTDLRPRETAVGFLICNILTVETSLWGCGQSDRTV